MLYNANFSSMLLGCLMLQPNLLFQPSFPLSKKDFSPEPFHQILFICIAKVAQSGAEEITEVEIENYAKNFPAQLETLVDNNYFEFISTVKELCVLSNYEMYYTAVRKFGLLRELKEQGFDIKDYFDELQDEEGQMAKLNEWSIQEILSDIELKGIKLRNKYDVKYVRDEMNAGEDTPELLEHFEDKPAFGALLQSPYLSTLYQGWCRGHLLLRSAPSGVGKSRLAVADLMTVGAKQMWDEDAQDFVDNPNYQGPTFFIHSEMSTRFEIAPMFLACVSGVEYRTITNGLYTPEEKARVLKAGEILLDSQVALVDMPDFTNRSIERKIKEQVESRGATYGVFDYVQLQGALAAEYKSLTNMPVREDLVLKACVTELKAMAEAYNIGLFSMTQLNDNWKTAEFPDESCLSGAKSIKVKLDGASVVLGVKERPKEYKRIEPYLRHKGFGSGSLAKPNMIEYIYKARFGLLGAEKIKIWSYFDRGTFRRTDFFCTDVKDELVKVNRSVIKEEF